MKAGNFAALQSKDHLLIVWKDLNLSKKYTKNQEASSILRVGIAFSKRPLFNSTYVVDFMERSKLIFKECLYLVRQFEPKTSDFEIL